MQNTTYYNLKKPEGTDFYNIENENDNMDVIDGELKDHADAITELNTKTNGSILADIASGYSAISSSSGRAVYNKIGSLCIVDLQLTRSSAITSGSMTLPQSMPTPWSSFHGALADPSNGSVGHIEVNTNRMLYLRCQTGSGFLTGQLVYIAAQ